MSLRNFYVYIALCLPGALLGAESAALPSLAAMGGCAPQPATLSAWEKLNAGDTAEAQALFSAAVKKDSDDVAALNGLRLLAHANCDEQKAMELLCKAVVAGGESPWDEYFIERLSNLLPFCKDTSPFEKLAENAVLKGGKKLRPQVRDVLRLRYAGWLMRRGKFSEAAEVLRPLHFIDNWALIGPFDNRDKAGFESKYEPEDEIDFEKAAAGRNRPVRWFPIQITQYDGRVNLSEIFEPHTHALSYAAAFVNAPAATRAVLRASFGGALAVQVNGKPIGTVSDYNDFGLDKLSAPISLREGWNQILIKSAVAEDTEWAFSVRLCNLEGGPLQGVSFDNSAKALAEYKQQAPAPGSSPAKEEEAVADLGLVNVLRKHSDQYPDDVVALAAYAALLVDRKWGDKENSSAPRIIAKAIEIAPASAWLRLQLASISDDRNEARLAVESLQPGVALAALPLAARVGDTLTEHGQPTARLPVPPAELPAALEMLAYLAHESHMHVAAEDYAHKALTLCGPEKAVWSALVLADVLMGNEHAFSEPGANALYSAPGSRNQRAEALRIVRELVRGHPYLPEGWKRLLALEESKSEIEETLLKALSFCGGDHGLRMMRSDRLMLVGKEAEGAAFLADALPLRPFNAHTILNAATAVRRAGDLNGSIELLERARRNAPGNPDILSALAYDKHHAGQTTEAVALLKEVLQLKPGAPLIKDYLAQLDQGRAVDRQFFAPFDIGIKDLASCPAESYPADNIATMLNQEVVRVNPNGSCSRMIHRVVKLLRSAGLNEVRQHSIWYDPGRQVVDILRAAVITPDGRELSRATVHDRSTAAAMGVQTLIYDEHHLKQVSFNDVEPGSIIDLQYTIRDNGNNMYGDYFADTFYFSDGQPACLSQYILDYPKELVIQSRTFNLASGQIPGGDNLREVVKWELSNIPGVVTERGMPPVVETLPQLQITTMRSWQDVGTWYWNLAKDQLAVSDEMRAGIQELTRDCKTPTEKLRVIHDWVIRKIRYLGIEFGRNGYRPHRAGDTYKSLYGDCKDTAALVTAMLQAAGIESRLVLIRTVNAGAVPANSLPMPNLFNHCIAYVPNVEGKDYWIDGTTDFFRLGEIPYADRGAEVLVAGPSGGQFMQVPAGAAIDNLVDEKFSARVAKGGSATVEVRDIRYGQFAPVIRMAAETPGKLESSMKDYAARRFNGAEITRINTSGPLEQGAPWIEMDLTVPALGSPSGERLTLPAAVEPLYMSGHYATEAKRTFPLELYYPWVRKTEINYQLDPGLKVVALPDESNLVEPFGKYVRSVKPGGGTVKIEEELDISKSRISVEEYEAFRLFCNKVDSLMEQKVLLQGK